MKRKADDSQQPETQEELKEPESKRQKLEESTPITQPPEATSYLDKLKLDSFEPLNQMSGRQDCPQCKASRRYFCYDCMIAIGDSADKIPRLDLPINVTVLRHPKEKISKSSIVPSKILAPERVTIKHEMEISPIRDDKDPYDSVVLLFPAPDAKDIATMDIDELKAIKRVVLIDCTWNQTTHFLKQENVMKLKKVKIQTEKTVFWRYQRIAETNLSTIEAMYFFFRDYDVNLNCGGKYELYDGKWDNILYYYAFNYYLIQRAYREGDKKELNFLKIPGYISGRDPCDIGKKFDKKAKRLLKKQLPSEQGKQEQQEEQKE